jgi:hypothetical protein
MPTRIMILLLIITAIIAVRFTVVTQYLEEGALKALIQSNSSSEADIQKMCIFG